MPARLPTAQRRLQIADAILELLGSCSIEGVTTRRVAELVGISQPALFRHFPSRDELLIAAVDRVREELAPLAMDAIRIGGVDGIHVLTKGLFQHAKVFPGIPRLLFYGGAMIGSQAEEQFPRFHKSLRLMVSMQRNLVAQLLIDAVKSKSIVTELGPDNAARFFVGLVQGMMFQFRFDAENTVDSDQLAASVMEFWLNGLQAGGVAPLASALPAAAGNTPGELGEDFTDAAADKSADDSVDPIVGKLIKDSANAAADKPAEDSRDPASALNAQPFLAPQSPFLELDVRPILESGVDPLMEIQKVLAKLPADGLLLLTAPFEPRPLLTFLQTRGHRVQTVSYSEDHWEVQVLGKAAPDVIDLRELEAPEPLEHCLLASGQLKPEQSFLARLPRVPRLLLPRLQERGLQFWIHEEPDASALLYIKNPAQ